MFEALCTFCALVNREILRFYGRPDSCVFSTAVIVEVLTYFGLKAEPIRVEAAIFPDDRNLFGCILGGFGDGSRRKAPDRSMWHGHLVSLVEDRYLLDSTLDQVQVPGVGPLVIDLRKTKWFDPDALYRGLPWTAVLRPWPTARLSRRDTPCSTARVGWKHAGDFRPCRRKEIVEMLIGKAAPPLELQNTIELTTKTPASELPTHRDRAHVCETKISSKKFFSNKGSSCFLRRDYASRLERKTVDCARSSACCRPDSNKLGLIPKFLQYRKNNLCCHWLARRRLFTPPAE
jgi:hypothetical protein